MNMNILAFSYFQTDRSIYLIVWLIVLIIRCIEMLQKVFRNVFETYS